MERDRHVEDELRLWMRARNRARVGASHRALAGTRYVGSRWDLVRPDVCEGRLRTAYIRPARNRWSAFGIVCSGCFTVWPEPPDA